VSLLRLAPELPTCADCRQWWYDPKDWKRMRRAGQELPRPLGCPTPCWKCPKSTDGKPNPGAELSLRNWRALEYARQCAVDTLGLLPQDRIVVRNNAIIRNVEERLSRHQAMTAMIGLLGPLAGLAGVPGASGGLGARGSRTR